VIVTSITMVVMTMPARTNAPLCLRHWYVAATRRGVSRADADWPRWLKGRQT
jgi:hypothetical protein